VVQVALALVLLICSGLMIRTFRAVMHVNPGFAAPDSIQTFRIYVPETDIPDSDADRLVRMEQGMMEKLATLPGVSSAAITSSLPMTGTYWTDPVFVKDHTYKEGELPPLRRFRFVSPGLFKTMGTPILAGRDLTWEDIYSRLPVAVVSENVARENWHDPQNALGKMIRVASTDDWRQIVGVVGDEHDDGVDQKAPGIVYWPLIENNFEGQKVLLRRGISFVIRTPRAGSQAFLSEVRRVVWSMDSSLPLTDTNTMGYYYTRSMARTSFTLVMLAVAGAMAMLLGVVGIYGVISYSVTRERGKLGFAWRWAHSERQLLGCLYATGWC
jgi:MacB-like periplasmic core domain